LHDSLAAVKMRHRCTRGSSSCRNVNKS